MLPPRLAGTWKIGIVAAGFAGAFAIASAAVAVRVASTTGQNGPHLVVVSAYGAVVWFLPLAMDRLR
jgi:hypothetical protein